jgi:dihydroxy-acid dehydratase
MNTMWRRRNMSGKDGKLRSQAWFGGTSRDSMMHRSWMKNEGMPPDSFDGRPVIGICNTWSELTPCNAHLRQIAERVKRGVYEAGGLPLEFPVMSLGESNLRPTAMLFRNLVSMDVEESIRGNPIDGVVLLVGCDKTTPALLMGAATCDLPAIAVSGGPMLNGQFRGKEIGSGTDLWRFSEDVKAGKMPLADFLDSEAAMSRSPGHCMTMGTASTMATMVESLGMGMPGNAAIPAVDSRRMVLAQLAGRRIVAMVREDLVMSKVLTRSAFENAIRVNAAVGGSTNAVIHLVAMARRLGLRLTLRDLDELSDATPVLVDLKPTGQGYMEDFFAAGGVAGLLRRLSGLIDLDAMTVTGGRLRDTLPEAEDWIDDTVIRRLDEPVSHKGGIVALSGSLAPNGAILKRAAADEALFERSFRAIVFEDLADLAARIDAPDLDVTPEDGLILRRAGPRACGMPEAGYIPIPRKLAQQGVKDMLRISDARMSGTAYGTIVLHVSPEAEAGGPIGLVRTGDRIEMSVARRSLDLLVDAAELERRRAAAPQAAPGPQRGWRHLYREHVLQAEDGCDLDFLTADAKSR